jgi:16S rRNA (cytosine1402-N4)-methyltransferase
LSNQQLHIPVLLHEVLENLQLAEGKVVVDATLGMGGHSLEMLKIIGKSGKLIGFDVDKRNLDLASEKFKKFKNVKLIQANFRVMGNFLEANSVDAILMDIGMSSLHFDDASRGFSFQREGNLDMRLNQSQPFSAKEIVNGWSENNLMKILREYGEINTAAKVARGIITARRIKSIETTLDLAAAIEAKTLLPQVFQALRIAVNDELSALEEGLASAVKLLRPGGRIGVISFHSLEDRIVKNFFRENTKRCICPPEKLKCDCKHSPLLKIITKKPIKPGKEEIEKNPRSRSALLRIAEKL